MNQKTYWKDRPAILLADPGDGFRGLPRFLLRDQGFTVVEATHGLEALFLAKRGAPVDVLIARETLPFLDGMELSTKLRALNPNLKTIVLSVETRPTGILDNILWLQNDCSETTLLSSIRTLLDRSAEGLPTAARDLLQLNRLMVPVPFRKTAFKAYTAGSH